MRRRSILIQAIEEYLGIIKPYLHVAMSTICNMDEEREVIKWVIGEELELIYGIFLTNHQHNHRKYSAVHNRLDGMLPIALSKITARYIKAPQIYSEYVADISITNCDLTIEYNTNVNLLSKDHNASEYFVRNHKSSINRSSTTG